MEEGGATRHQGVAFEVRVLEGVETMLEAGVMAEVTLEARVSFRAGPGVHPEEVRRVTSELIRMEVVMQGVKVDQSSYRMNPALFLFSSDSFFLLFSLG